MRHLLLLIITVSFLFCISCSYEDAILRSEQLATAAEAKIEQYEAEAEKLKAMLDDSEKLIDVLGEEKANKIITQAKKSLELVTSGLETAREMAQRARQASEEAQQAKGLWSGILAALGALAGVGVPMGSRLRNISAQLKQEKQVAMDAVYTAERFKSLEYEDARKDARERQITNGTWQALKNYRKQL